MTAIIPGSAEEVAAPQFHAGIRRSTRGEALVTVTGELDVAAAPRLRGLLTELLDTDPVRVVVDLSGLSFIDSTGLGVLVGAEKRARQRFIEFVLHDPPAPIWKVFQITGIDRVVSVERHT